MESPIQLIWQLWLVLNGIIDLDWHKVSSIYFTDFQGNTIYLPFTASLCISFSIIMILKAVMEFNIHKVHIPVLKKWVNLFRAFPIYLDMIPFLVIGSFFRIASLLAIMTYLQVFGVLSILGLS